MAAIIARCNVVSALVLIATTLSAFPAHPQQAVDEPAIKRCIAIMDEAARLHCLQALSATRQQGTPLPAPASPSTPALAAGPASSTSRELPGGWRMVRAHLPKAEDEVVSVMRTAELSDSDPNLAGMTIRCGDPDPEILVVLLRPLPPRAQAKVTLNGVQWDGTVLPPGAEVRLPVSAAALPRAWASQQKLSIQVDEDGTSTKGVISLDGFDNAFGVLQAACLARQQK